MKPRKRDLYFEIAARHCPPDLSHIMILSAKWKRSMKIGGSAFQSARTMLVQRPDTLLKLWRFLHECAHFKMHRSVAPGTSYHLVELEADRYARDAIRDAGIEISETFLCVRKEYLYSELLADLRTGYDMSPGIVEYMGWSEQEGLELVAIMRKLPRTKKHLRGDFAEKLAAHSSKLA